MQEHTRDVRASPGSDLKVRELVLQSLDIDTAGQQPLETHSLLHAGFVRLAMQQNADLVPVLCLGELSALRNFVDLPGMQVWALCCQMRPPSSQPFRPPHSLST